MSHQTSTNLVDWSEPVTDAIYGPYIEQPGMTVVAHIPPLGKYIIVYEHGLARRSRGGNRFPVNYRLASDPRKFDLAAPKNIEATNWNRTSNRTLEPGSAPYVVWSPVGGVNGTIVVTDANHGNLFINRFGGDEKRWEARRVVQPGAYARALHVMKDRPDHLVIVGAGPYRNQPKNKIPLSVSVVNLTALLTGDEQTVKRPMRIRH